MSLVGPPDTRSRNPGVRGKLRAVRTARPFQGQCIIAHVLIICRCLGQGGKPLWDRWASNSDKFDHDDQDRVWRSIKRNGVTIATVFHLAQQAGWDPVPDREAWKECGRLMWRWRREPRRAWDEFRAWCGQQGISAARAEHARRAWCPRSRRHQPNGVADRLKLTRPIVR